MNNSEVIKGLPENVEPLPEKQNKVKRRKEKPEKEPMKTVKHPQKEKIGGKMGVFTTVILLLPYMLAFIVFIVLPVILAAVLSFTDFNSISAP